MKRRNVAVVQWSIQWANSPLEEATGEDAEALEQQYPTFYPWGQGSLHKGVL